MNNLPGNNYKKIVWMVQFQQLESKCYWMLFVHLTLSTGFIISVILRGSIIESSNCEKLLGIFIDSNFSFEYHTNSISRKVYQNLHALSVVSKYISEVKKRTLFKSFIISQFNYCLTVWMCHGRGSNNKINNIYERALSIVYQDKQSSFETWQISVKSYESFQYLAAEVFNEKKGLSLEITK